AAYLADVAREALELLVHVEPLQQQRQLLLEPLRVDARGQLGEPLLEARAHARLQLRQPCAHLRHQRLESGAALLEQLAQPRPFARARRRQLLERDRKSTRLNSSHSQISYAVFCLKKKKLCYINQQMQTSAPI